MHILPALALVSGLLPASPLGALALPSQSQNLVSRASTCNTAEDRSCWSDGFDISSDYETSIPNTGVTRQYALEITEESNWTGPDGVVKDLIMVINGQFPGPVLTADWGDTMEITVTNNLLTNGTSMHWHGIHQRNTNTQDGVNGVTECPLAPGASRVYTFRAEQYGTSWYHSHFSAQYGNGLFGGLIINGPASAPYDIDLGIFPVGDYYYDTADNLVEYTANNAPPASDNVLFNGTNINPKGSGGAYANVTLTPGKTHRLRLLNPSVENHFALSLAGHSFTIIAADLVPMQPQNVTQLFMAPGQRYDVLITADQDVDNYWFNATFSSDNACGTSKNGAPAAIFHYAGADGGLPTSPGAAITLATCTDLIDLEPVLARTVDVSNFLEYASNTIPISLDINTTSTQLFNWKVNGSQARTNWNRPVDQYLMEGNTDYPVTDNIVQVPSSDEPQWVYWLIENDPNFAIPHPIHLHGHDFVVLARSDPSVASPASFDATVNTLNGNNPTRRDVVMLPSLGWLVIAFQTDNPGAWLMHCHIAWHVSGGFALTFLENVEDFRDGLSEADKTQFEDVCAVWNDYFPDNAPYPQSDSGLRKLRRSFSA